MQEVGCSPSSPFQLDVRPQEEMAICIDWSMVEGTELVQQTSSH